jgi:hypothetical protein
MDNCCCARHTVVSTECPNCPVHRPNDKEWTVDTETISVCAECGIAVVYLDTTGLDDKQLGAYETSMEELGGYHFTHVKSTDESIQCELCNYPTMGETHIMQLTKIS